MSIIGKPVNRVDGILKVTGQAKYAAEYKHSSMAYAFPVMSKIASGTIAAIDSSAAEKAPGVITVLTHKNALRLQPIDVDQSIKTGSLLGELLLPLQDTKIFYANQYIGLVVAETYEQARYAAQLVKVDYNETKPAIDLDKEPKVNSTSPRAKQIIVGNPTEAFDSAPIKINRVYTVATENHHPMEPHSMIAAWEGEKLTVYNATQGVHSSQHLIAQTFGISKENVRVIAAFIGGAFGTKAMFWAHEPLTVMAAKVVRRPVKFVLTRPMMQHCTGNRGATKQTLYLGASRDGKLVSRRHITDTYVARLDDRRTEYLELAGANTSSTYACPNIEITHQVALLNVNSPTPMRAPGEAPGLFALESAMDELAYELKIDPVELRLINYGEVNPINKLPYSSKHLKECYEQGAAKFGWNKRKSDPRQIRDGQWLVGYGMATALYPGYRSTSSARVRVNSDGTVSVQTAAHDLGTGTYTIVAQTAAEFLRVPVEKVKVALGDTSLPASTLAGGSRTAATVVPGVWAACEALRKKFFELAATKNNSSVFSGKAIADVELKDGGLFLKSEKDKGETFQAILKAAKMDSIEECVTVNPEGQKSNEPCFVSEISADQNADTKKWDFHSFGAQFVEVGVNEDIGTVRIRRVLSYHDCGRIINEKTARSQAFGGVIFGIGMALTEESHYDPRNGRFVTRSLVDYHVPVNLDVPSIEVYFTNKPDYKNNPLGVRGVGEIVATGVAPAIANAIFNATGKRLRDLPITPDKLL
jgi:xanthine dehydrogenase YagR molybdenum-binding subunit